MVPHTLFVFLFVSRHIQDPASQRLTWNTPPKSVLVIKKIQDASLLEPFKELCIFLTEVSPDQPPSTSLGPRRRCLTRTARTHTRGLLLLLQVKNMIVYVEKKVLEDPAISSNENFGAITKDFCTFREGATSSRPPLTPFAHHPARSCSVRCRCRVLLFPDLDNISNLVDFIICLGGDGTLLYASSLFQVVLL